MFRQISKTVLLISLVSLFNDFSSEMLYPIIPLYLKQIGYTLFWIGLLEGIAEFIAGISKIYMGSLSDTFNRRLPFIQFGYALSIIVRPIMGFTSWIGVIFASRSLDRVGKGIRSGARDAMLADECNTHNKAEIFGFHRAMDTLGAIFGPLLALLYLHFYPTQYTPLFFITLIPGILALATTFLIKENKENEIKTKNLSLKTHLSYYKQAHKSYLHSLILLLIFSLANTSDMFLLMRAQEIGFEANQIIFLYLLFNLSFALFAFPIGRLADQIGHRKIFCLGLSLFISTYILFAFTHSKACIYLACTLYGLFYACTQGIAKVILLQSVSPTSKSSAIGFYDGTNSILLLLSNALAGWIWIQFGAPTMLLFSATIATLVLFLSILQTQNLKQATS